MSDDPMIAKMCAWWFQKQALDGSMTGCDSGTLLRRSGWSRSVGGCGPYLTLFARGRVRRAEADDALAMLSIQELPCARGCTYVVPREEYALALAAGRAMGESGDIVTAKRFLGVTEQEIGAVADGIVAALASEPLDPAALKKALGAVVRNLGEAGKKRGVTTTLPLALGRLQTTGKIRRVPMNGRIDQQRYAYALWDGDIDFGKYEGSDPFLELAERYFRWIGPASIASFQGFAGVGVKAARELAGILGLRPISEGSDLLILPDELAAYRDFETPAESRFALVSSLDSLLLHRRDIRSILAPADLNKRVVSDKGPVEVGSLAELSYNAIVDRSRLIGLWEYDSEAAEIVWATFQPAHESLRATILETEAFIRDQMGDARSFSLDSPKSRKPRIDALRAARW